MGKVDAGTLYVLWQYACTERSQTDIANDANTERRYRDQKAVSNCVIKYLGRTGEKGFQAKNSPMRKKLFAACDGMSISDFEYYLSTCGGVKNTQEFIDNVNAVRARGNAQGYSNAQDYSESDPFERQPTHYVDTSSARARSPDTSGMPVFFTIIGVIAAIVAAIIFLPRVCGGGGASREEGVINEVKHFSPTLLSGLTIGDMFDGISENGTWSTYEVTDRSGLFNSTTNWVRFSGSSSRGNVSATFTVTKDRTLDYTCSVAGKPTPLDELYRMFHDPNYDRDLEAAIVEAENEAKFEEAEARILIMPLVHNYVPAEFGGMTVLEFTDSVCASGEWVTNDNAASLRVVFEGESELGAVQAIFNVDIDTGWVEPAWYFNSREIEATELYLMFYGE